MDIPSRLHDLVVSPATLYFPPPLNQKQLRTFKLTNNSSHHIAFKVLTNRPNRYIVKPKNGVVPSDSSVTIQVGYTPAKDQPTSLRCKDKFQIKSVAAGPLASVDEMFSSVSPSQVSLQKVRCKFESPPSRSSGPSRTLRASRTGPFQRYSRSEDAGSSDAARSPSPKTKPSTSSPDKDELHSARGEAKSAGDEDGRSIEPAISHDAGTQREDESGLEGKVSSLLEKLESRASEMEKRISKVNADLEDFEDSIEKFTGRKKVAKKPPTDASFYFFSIVLAILCAAVAYLYLHI